MPTRVLLADDHPIIRQGLTDVLQADGYAVVALCADGHEAVRAATKLHPEVAFLDLSMPLLNGIDAAREIRQTSPRTKTIVLSVHHEEQYVLAALRAGVDGYVLKSEAGTALTQAIREARLGRLYLSPGASRAIVDACQSEPDQLFDVLTPRERRILQLIAEGRTTKEIGEELNLTFKSAEFNRTALMEKLEIRDTANLVRYAVRLGLVEL